MHETSVNYIRSAHLTDVLELERIARGVNMEITQLDAGPFESKVVQLKVRNVLASLITSNRRLRVRGDVSFLTFSFLSADSGLPIWRGVPVKPSDLVVANAGETFDLVIPPGVEGTCVSATDIAEVTLRNLGGPILSKVLVGTDSPISCDADSMLGIRSWLAERRDDFSGDSKIPTVFASELEREFLRRLAVCVRARTPSSDRNSPASGRIDAVQRVEEHLLRDIEIPRTVDELCLVAGTSRRTLEYAFNEYFGTSPKQFIKALRLNAARNDLLRSDHSSAQVAEVATGWGFSHMSQFATDYHRMFGEKPSDTLRRSG